VTDHQRVDVLARLVHALVSAGSAVESLQARAEAIEIAERMAATTCW